MKKKWIVVFIVGLIAIVSVVMIRAQKSYEVVSPKKGSITEAVYGLGTVQARRVYEVKIGVINSVQKVYFHEGDKVKKGDLLISFIEGPRFYAPFPGTITTINFNQGELVPPQVTVLRLEDLNQPYIEVSLEQEGALMVSPGQSARVLFESMRGQVLNGKVSSLFPKNGEFIAQIEVDQISSKVLPGMTADVTIEVGEIKDATLIPVSSIHNGQVIIKRDGKKKKLKVDIGRVDSLWAEVKGEIIQLSDEILIPIKEKK